MTTKILYKTTYTIEVLTEEKELFNLQELLYEIEEGDASGHELRAKTVIVEGMDAVKECEIHGTDIDFFQMDEDGNEIEY